MFEEHFESMTAEEIARLNNLRKPSWLESVLGRKRIEEESDYVAQRSQVLEVSVEKCFVLKNFDEENPLYILDVGNRRLLVLFGQWLYDPNVVVASHYLLQRWSSELFFSSFTLRRAPNSGTALRLQVHGTAFIAVERLQAVPQFKQLRETQVVSGTSDLLMASLREADLIG